MYVLILLFVVVVAWVGLSIYFEAEDEEVDSNASSYTNPVDSTFDTEEIEKINTRIEEGFSVSPEEFFLLIEDSN